jgi:hypothetical protein
MRRQRFSIAALMALMIPFALALVAMREASQLWVNIIFNVVVAALLGATYKAKCAQGVAGAWWTGFAAFGWAHLVLGLIGMPWSQHYGVSPNLLTQEIVWRVWAFLARGTSGPASREATARILITHSAVSLLVALIGARALSFLARRGWAMESSNPVPPADRA